MEKIGDRIKQRRTELNMTMEELANKLGLSKSTIHKYESGKVQNIKRPMILKLSKVLQISPSYLLDIEEADKEIEKDFDTISDIKCNLSLEEFEIVKKIRKLPENDKEEIKNYIDYRYVKSTSCAASEEHA